MAKITFLFSYTLITQIRSESHENFSSTILLHAFYTSIQNIITSYSKSSWLYFHSNEDKANKRKRTSWNFSWKDRKWPRKKFLYKLNWFHVCECVCVLMYISSKFNLIEKVFSSLKRKFSFSFLFLFCAGIVTMYHCDILNGFSVNNGTKVKCSLVVSTC